MRRSLNKSKYLLTPEVEHLEHILKRFVKTNERDCLLIWMILKTGARAQEALNVRRKDLDNIEKTVFIRGLKGSHDREIPLNARLFDMVWKHAHSHKEERVFPISYSRLVQIWDFYRPCEKTIHALRHTFAIRLLQKTRDIRMVQYALGHTTLLSTTVYTEYLYTKSQLRKALG